MTQTVNANQFLAYITQQRAKIQSAFKETEQAQNEFQGLYTRFRAEHDRTLHALAEQLGAADAKLGGGLQTQVDARVAEERAAIKQRLANLERAISKAQTQADSLIKRAQKEFADLRALNPKLNEREEDLKTQRTRAQQTLDDLNGQIAQMGKGLGFIFSAWKIHALDRERFQTLGHLETFDAQLLKVRREWQELRALALKNETDWQTQWEKATADLGGLRQERDYLAQNGEAEARRRALVFALDHLKAVPGGMDAALAQPMIALNVQTDNFQAALGAVAGILGVLRGVDDGLGRIGESAKAIVTEQQRHSTYLHPPTFMLSDRVLEFGKTWDDLIAQVKNEKQAAQHPADFVAAMRTFVEQRLGQDQVSAFFTGLGGALTAATQGWKA